VFSKTSQKDVAKDKVAEAASAVGNAATATVGDAAETAREKLAPVVETATQRLNDALDAAQPHLREAKKSAGRAAEEGSAALTDAAQPHLKKAKKSARKAAKKAAKRARTASDQAYAALPDQARTTVELVVPQVARKRKKKGTVFIALGLLAGAAAVALLVRGKQQAAGDAVAGTQLPAVERRDAAAVEASEPIAATGTDDAVGEAEQQADAALSGRRGRHAANE